MVELANVNELLKRSQAMDRTLANPATENERRTGDRNSRVHPFPVGSSASDHVKKHTRIPSVSKLVNSVRRLKKTKNNDKQGRTHVASDDEPCDFDEDDGDDEDDRTSLDKPPTTLPSSILPPSTRANFGSRQKTSQLSGEEDMDFDSNTDESGIEHARYSPLSTFFSQNRPLNGPKRSRHRVSFGFMSPGKSYPESPPCTPNEENKSMPEIMSAQDIMHYLIKRNNTMKDKVVAAEKKKRDLEEEIANCKQGLRDLDNESEHLVELMKSMQERKLILEKAIVKGEPLWKELDNGKKKFAAELDEIARRGVATDLHLKMMHEKIQLNNQGNWLRYERWIFPDRYDPLPLMVGLVFLFLLLYLGQVILHFLVFKE